MKRILILATVTGALFAATLPTVASAHHTTVTKRTVWLHELNDSGVWGKAVLTQSGSHLRVQIQASGLTPFGVHAQHIHGFDGWKNATCPPFHAANDIPHSPPGAAHPWRVLSLEEGLPYYGPVKLELTPFPTANRYGKIWYDRTFTVGWDLQHLRDEAIVLHGKPIASGYEPTLPVACGEID